MAGLLAESVLPTYELYADDCRVVLPTLEAESVHLVLTDPPYFLDGLDNGWAKGEGGPRGTGAVGGLPVGMRFDPQQGRRLQEFLRPVADELYRVLKPGGFLLMFSAGRLYHRMATAVEDSGFEIRDLYVWSYRGKAQFKAFTLDHFVRRRTDIDENEKERIIRQLDGRRTPQLRPQFEQRVSWSVLRETPWSASRLGAR